MQSLSQTLLIEQLIIHLGFGYSFVIGCFVIRQSELTLFTCETIGLGATLSPPVGTSPSALESRGKQPTLVLAVVAATRTRAANLHTGHHATRTNEHKWSVYRPGPYYCHSAKNSKTSERVLG